MAQEPISKGVESHRDELATDGGQVMVGRVAAAQAQVVSALVGEYDLTPAESERAAATEENATAS